MSQGAVMIVGPPSKVYPSWRYTYARPPGLVALLHDRDLVPLRAQPDGRRESTESTADDDDLHVGSNAPTGEWCHCGWVPRR
jgi:hypothetical protein